MATATAKIRPYDRYDEAELIQAWNKALWCDPITVETWRAKILLDPNFDPDTCLVAEIDDRVQGFALGLTRQVPFFNDGLEPALGWITAMGVDPDFQRMGIGSALLSGVLAHLRDLGRSQIVIGPYIPHYFTPGVDVSAYTPALAFFAKHGFAVTMRPLSMKANLTGFTPPESLASTYEKLDQGGIAVRPALPDDIVPVLRFIRDHFSWDWHREATGVFQDLFAGLGDPRQVSLLVAEAGDEVVGYAQHRAERFGPFGVRADRRSQGIGRVLLAETLLSMRAKNLHAAWFLWTSEQAARLYAQCGFEPARRFAVMAADI